MREAIKQPLQRRHTTGLLVGAVLMVLIHVVGTLGYHYLGRPVATWIDSFYMTFITVATIGFGEVVDLTHHPMGRLFTVFIAVVGIGTMSYVFSKSVALLVDSDLNSAIRTARMEKQITKLRGHYIVCGIGRVGSNVAMELLETKRTFVVIESDLAAFERWLENHPDTFYLHADAADDDALQRAGVAQSAGVFAVTGDDSHNLMVSMSVKLLNPKSRVVARLHDIRNSTKARKAGADEIVSPDFTGGMRIASAMVRPHVVNFIDQMLHSDLGLRLEEVVIPPGFAAQALGSLAPRAQEYLVVAVRENDQWVFNPADDHLLQGGATLVFMADTGGRQALEKQLLG
jgi:voltage-gated potassium channel